MDRTAWIVVTLCAIGMGICFYIMNTQQPLPVQGPVPAPYPDDQLPEQADTVPAPQLPEVDPGAPEHLHTVKMDNVEWVFTNKGGGISVAHLLPGLYVGDHQYVINNSPKGAIGALSTSAGNVDNGVYELKSPEGLSPVIYAGVFADGLVVEKTFTLSKSEAASGYLWDLKVTLSNPSDAGKKEDIYFYTGNTATVHNSDLIMPSVGWNADGDTDSWDMGSFKSKGFMGFGRRGDIATDLVKSGNYPTWQWMALFNQFYTTLLSPRDVTKPEAASYWVEYFETTESQPANAGADAAAPAGPPIISSRLHMAVGPGRVTLDAGITSEFNYELYIGPRSHNILEAVDAESRDQGSAANREDVLFYGWFGIVSRFLMSTMTFLERYVGSWGLAIVILTICIRTVIWPLHAKSHNTMKRMALLSPKMQELKEKYPDNPQKMQQEVMKLYRDYGVSPVGGCLPIFLQFPIFLGYYRMLQSAVELRGQGFLWAPDLSVPDTVATFAGIDINPLPLVMTITMFIQMKMTPKSNDANVQAQQRMFMFMPFVFLFICYNFASALALYWTVQNIFGIGQTLIMKRMPEPALEKRAPREAIAAPGQTAKKKKPKPPRPGG
ncbi:MAG: membrane protein insertase YidC [Verrucomicrobia bacterium]|nr:membrane protein insertase YidC [Verrucomicrobiota bacterium]